jgi:hypothetical protein
MARKENLIVEVLWKCPENEWIKANIDESAIVNIFAMNIGRNNAFVDVLTSIMTRIERAKQEGWSKLWIETDSMLSFKNKDFVPWA